MTTPAQQKPINPEAQWKAEFDNFLKRAYDAPEENNGPKIPKLDYEKLTPSEGKQKLREQLGPVLRHIGKDVPTQSKGGMNLHCPYHEDHTPSMSYSNKSNALHCFVCMGVTKDGNQKRFDIFDLIGEVFSLSFFRDKLAYAERIFVGQVSKKSSSKSSTLKPKSSQPLSFTSEQNLNSTSSSYNMIAQDFLKERGITPETADRFKLSTWVYQENEYLVIPGDDGFCTRRLIKKGKGSYPKFWNKQGIAMSLFNSQAIEKVSNPIFVVESALCAMLLEQHKLTAVALNGATNHQKLLKKIIKNKKIANVFILLLDFDQAGYENTLKLSEKLKRSKIKHVLASDHTEISKLFEIANCKDPSELINSMPNAAIKQFRQFWFATEQEFYNEQDIRIRFFYPERWLDYQEAKRRDNSSIRKLKMI